jgi:hypothetical protein
MAKHRAVANPQRTQLPTADSADQVPQDSPLSDLMSEQPQPDADAGASPQTAE